MPSSSKVPNLSAATASILGSLLPQYAAARRRWPLWTYARGEPRDAERWLTEQQQRVPATTWYGWLVWPDRLRFSPTFLFGVVSEQLRERLERSGFKLFMWLPHQAKASIVSLKPNRVPGPGGAELLPRSIDVPADIWLRTLAIWAQTAVAVPTNPKDIRMSDLLPTVGIDAADLSELLREVEEGLVGFRKTDVRQALLSRIVNYHLLAASGETKLRKVREELEGALREIMMEKTGLLTTRRGGRKTLLPPTLVLDLYEEALRIVADVRSWEPDDETVKAISGLVSADPVSDLSKHGHMVMERSRVMKRRPVEQREQTDDRLSPYEELARQMAYPFLTLPELRILVPGPENRVKQAARRLLQERLPAAITDRSLQYLLSTGRGTRGSLQP